MLSLRASAVSKGLKESEARVDGSWRKGKPQRTGTVGYAALGLRGHRGRECADAPASSDSRREHQQALRKEDKRGFRFLTLVFKQNLDKIKEART